MDIRMQTDTRSHANPPSVAATSQTHNMDRKMVRFRQRAEEVVESAVLLEVLSPRRSACVRTGYTSSNPSACTHVWQALNCNCADMQYDQMYKESIDAPEKFWGRLAEELHWERKVRAKAIPSLLRH